MGSWAWEFMGEACVFMGAGAEAFVSDRACKETIGDGPKRDMDRSENVNDGEELF